MGQANAHVRSMVRYPLAGIQAGIHQKAQRAEQLNSAHPALLAG